MIRPNPTPIGERARPCPLCAEDDTAFGVIRIWTRSKFNHHVAEIHPGIDAACLWAFPMPNRRANG